MDTIAIILQLVIAIGIVNVWIFRFSKSSNWRGGEATNMKEEFALYGLPEWFMKFIGFLKLLSAVALIGGIWYPQLVTPAGIVIAILMLGAIIMHFKVKDPIKKSLPACILLVSSVIVALV